MSDTINHSDWPEISRAISAGDVPTFRTRRDALATGKEYGWKKAIKFNRRFENVWILGSIDFQPDQELDFEFRVCRVCLARWIHDGNTTKSAIVKFRKLAK